ncbi:MAG: hypothetical protein JNN28_15800 [Saprospiraceae bacterium]|nr:hypothetical protein [Saprospiraceae bacterium]
MTKKRNILFVCIGNTCRSPMAECIAKYMFRNVIISSCGICVDSDQISSEAIKVIKDKLKIDLTNRAPRDIYLVNLTDINTIYSLDKKVTEYIKSYTDFKGNLVEILIEDPYNKPIEKYYDTYNELFNELTNIEAEQGGI